MTPDQSSRDIARKRLDANIVVEAGAGTGKTTLLTDRILFLLLAGGPEREGLPITKIVALTFTEKAAGEIKVRLAERLHDILARVERRPLNEKRVVRTDAWLAEARQEFRATDDGLRRMAGDALRELDRADIGTIHSFCKTLLQLFPLEAGVNPTFQMDKGDAFEDIFRLEWGQWLEQELVPGGPSETVWREILPHVGLRDMASLARAMTRAASFGESPEKLADRLAILRQTVERLSDGKPKPRRGKMLESLGKVADRLLEVERVVREPGNPLPSNDAWGEKAKSWPQEWKEFAGESLYREACSLLEGVSPLGEAILIRARKILSPFVDRCRATFRAAGWMGFDDLLRGARDLLADHPAVRRALKDRYGAVLVDEFQDTDPLQGEMLLFLSEQSESEADRWQDVSLAPGKLFIVGDPKQSIYRFRGADIRAYEAFVALVMGQGGHKCDLQTSFRTHAGIVDPLNQLFADLMVEEPGLQPAYLPLHPRPGESSAGGVELVLVTNDGAGENEETPSARSGQEAEARWITQWIVKNCGPEGSGRPWTLGDVALLFRSTSALSVHMDALKAAQIPYLVESDRAFYSAPEVVDFLNYLRVLQNPTDQISLVGLLRSPVLALEDREILLLSESAGLDDRTPLPEILPADLRARVVPFYVQLSHLRSAAQRDTLGELAARLLRETPLLAAAAVAYHGEQSVSNLFKLARLAAESNAMRGETLVGFTRRLSMAVGGSVEEGENPLGEEKEDAVRLLTVHKAKGLEYKVVMVPNLGAAVQRRNRKPPAVRQDWSEKRTGYRLIKRKWADLGMAFLEFDERRREKEESVRLFYVAATRAREHVIFVGNEKAAPGSFMEMLKKGAVSQEREWEWADGLRLPVTRVERDTLPPVRWPSKKKEDVPLLTVDLPPRWEKRLKVGSEIQGTPLFRSPSGTHQGEKKYRPLEISSGTSRAEAALIGQVVHGVLELWVWGESSDIMPFVERAARRLMAEHSRADWTKVKTDAHDILSTFLDSLVGRSIREKDVVAREAPFLYPESGGIVRGVIDLLYRRDGNLWVADFKTDRIKTDEAVAHAQRYAAQGRHYQEAVQRSLNESCGFEIIFLRTGDRVELNRASPGDSGSGR